MKKIYQLNPILKTHSVYKFLVFILMFFGYLSKNNAQVTVVDYRFASKSDIQNTSGGGNIDDIDIPLGTSYNNNVLLAQVVYGDDDNVGNFSIPSQPGWTLVSVEKIRQDANLPGGVTGALTQTTVYFAVYYKVVTTSTNTATFDFKGSGTSVVDATMVGVSILSCADLSSPIDASGLIATTGNANSGTIPATSITVNNANSRLFMLTGLANDKNFLNSSWNTVTSGALTEFNDNYSQGAIDFTLGVGSKTITTAGTITGGGSVSVYDNPLPGNTAVVGTAKGGGTFVAIKAAAAVTVSQLTANSISVCQNGVSPALTVSATGNPVLTYQWFSNTTSSNSSGTIISGAVGSTYNAPTSTTGQLYYYCEVTSTQNGVVCSKGVSATFRVRVNSFTTPTFTNPGPICIGSSLVLPNPSIEGINGTWSPAVNNTATTTYTFTPGLGGCNNTANMTVTVTSQTIPSFTQVAPVCAGTSFTLSTTSANGITGTWSPAINNTATTTYTFTPATGQCATTASMTVTVNPLIVPTFNQVGPLCEGSIFTLPTTSSNGITGTWSPSVNNLITTTYTFTPSAGQCANTASMTVTITPLVNPIFTNPGPICSGAIFTLSGTSNNGIYGIWTPAINNTATTTYTFTPDKNQCANELQMIVTVKPLIVPTFSIVDTYCSGASIPALPTTSTNGITGTWSPAINNTVTTTYTFTPASGLCATPVNSTITIKPNVTPTFTQLAAVCNGTSFTLPTTSNNGINGTWSPAINNTATTTYTFTPSLNVNCYTSTTMTVTITPKVTPTFSIPAFCIGQAINLPTTSNNGITGTWAANGNPNGYTFTPTAGLCANSVNITITIIFVKNPTFTQIGPLCAGTSFTLPITSTNNVNGNWSPAVNTTATTTYTFTPNSGQCASTASMTVTINPIVTPTFDQVGPVCQGTNFTLPATSTNGVTGTWSPVINTSSSTTYIFSPNAGQCATTAEMTVTITPKTVPTFTQVGPICSGTSFSLPGTSTNGFTGSWSPAINNTATTTYTFTPTPCAVILDPNNPGNRIAAPANCPCVTSATMTVTITPKVTPIFNQLPAVCKGTTFGLPTTSQNGITGTWSPAVNSSTTTTYTFTPSASACASVANMTVAIIQPTVPNFANIPTKVCKGSLTVLPTTSDEGIVGTWSPAWNPNANTTYTFTPNSGQCATSSLIDITIVAGVSTGITVTNSTGSTSNPILDCNTSSLVLTATATGVTYSWTEGSNPNQIENKPSITITEPGIYNVIVTNSLGCTASATVTVTLGTTEDVGVYNLFACPSIIAAGNESIITFSVKNTKPVSSGYVYPTGSLFVVYSLPPGLEFTYQSGSLAGNQPGSTGSYFNWTYNATNNTIQGINTAPMNPQNLETVSFNVLANAVIANFNGTLNLQVGDFINTPPIMAPQNCIVNDVLTHSISVVKFENEPTPVVINISCNKNTDGSVDLTSVALAYGYGPYIYTVENVGENNTGIFSNLQAGTYNYQIFDNNGCNIASSTFTITEPDALTASVLEVNALCNGGNGTITVNVTGGTPSYAFSSSNGVGTWAGNVLTAPSGSYTIGIVDANGCKLTVNGVIKQPIAISATITNVVNNSCVGGNQGSFKVTASGGTPSYTYQIVAPAAAAGNVSGATSGTFNNLASGNYTVKITDANGCTHLVNSTITQPTPSAIDLGSNILRPLNTIFTVNPLTKEGYVQVSNITNTPTSGTVKFRISKPTNFTINCNNTTLPASGNFAGLPIASFSNSSGVTISPVSVGGSIIYYEVETLAPIACGQVVRVGFKITSAGSSGTSGIMTCTILAGSGGDTNITNNISVKIFNIN